MNSVARFATITCVAAVLVARVAQAETLTFSNWIPATHPVTTEIVKPWSDSVGRESGGRITINILPKALGSPPAHYELARDGIADLVLAVPGYTPGRFVSDKLYSLPFLGDNAEATSVAAWRTYEKYFAKLNEFQGVKLLGVFTHGPGQLQTKKEIKSLDDLKGLKIRVTGGYIRDITSALGMVPLLKPATENYELLSTGVADGTTLPTESMVAFNLQKLVPYTTIVPGGLYCASFIIGMSEKKYQSLKPEDRSAVDKVSGEALARLGGRAFDAREAKVARELTAAGHKITVVSPEMREQIRKTIGFVEQQWIDEIKAKGVDGTAAVAFFRGEIRAIEKK